MINIVTAIRKNLSYFIYKRMLTQREKRIHIKYNIETKQTNKFPASHQFYRTNYKLLTEQVWKREV